MKTEDQREIFIEKIFINKVRHLENIEIDLSDDNKKHLILTGKNGSGKTSVLLAIKEYLSGVESNDLKSLEMWKIQINDYKNKLQKNEKLGLNNQETFELKTKISKYNNFLEHYQSITLSIKNLDNIVPLFKDGNYIITFFDSKRTLNLKIPKSIEKIDRKTIYSLEEKVNTDFLQYIVNLKADRSFSKDDNDFKTVKEIDSWFETFEKLLKDIFEDNDLKLEFDRKNYNFNILLKGHEKFDFNTLSDGYSSILNIITELILRMENKKLKNYDVQGIVLIDEIETHLHIDLQKQILPFLIGFFPKIQFIVTTHSPFVLNSVNNAIIYDLEKRLKVDDLSGYSYEGIVESYFDSDQYSEIIKKKVKEYEKLMSKTKLTEEQEDKLIDLKLYFKQLPKFLSPELSLKIQQIELAKIKK